MRPLPMFRRVAAVAVLAMAAVACSSDEPQVPTGNLGQDAATDSSTTTTPAASSSSTTGAADDTPVFAPSEELAGLPGLLVVRDSTGAIVVRNPDGTEAYELAMADGRRLSQPTWSPGGNQIAWSTDGSDGSSVSIWHRDTGDIDTYDSTTPPFFHSFSPDGTWLASLRSGGLGVELSLLSTTPDEQLRAVGSGAPFYFDWADDSSVLTAAVNGDVLAQVTPEDLEATVPLEPGAELAGFSSPAAHGQGAIVGVEGAVEGSIDLVSVAPSGNTPIATSGGPVSLALSPDGTKLAVLAFARAQPDVVAVQEGPDLAPGFVSIVDLASGAVETQPEQAIIALQWSPDSASLAMLQITDSDVRWFYKTGGDTVAGPSYVPSQEFLSQYLPFADQYNHNSTWWSPDGSAFALTGQIDGVGGVFIDVIDDGEPPIFAGEGDVAFWSA